MVLEIPSNKHNKDMNCKYYRTGLCSEYNIYLSRIKDKINHPPKKQDYQELSHNFSEFVKLKTNAKLGNMVKKIDVEDVPGLCASIPFYLFFVLATMSLTFQKIINHLSQTIVITKNYRP